MVHKSDLAWRVLKHHRLGFMKLCLFSLLVHIIEKTGMVVGVVRHMAVPVSLTHLAVVPLRRHQDEGEVRGGGTKKLAEGVIRCLL